ncbi:hypothetical protein Dda3937_03394 [Dickeya dadantii 3937]|uniref:Uncharacterized protein n=1 Tax=Dickeya dadantii (strain 3937) TaxID=198628 RepID=E0SBU2_DICD3|nr:hypothetical protein Dda3937_03394 [Dickeya dadantii 3937]
MNKKKQNRHRIIDENTIHMATTCNHRPSSLVRQTYSIDSEKHYFYLSHHFLSFTPLFYVVLCRTLHHSAMPNSTLTL